MTPWPDEVRKTVLSLLNEGYTQRQTAEKVTELGYPLTINAVHSFLQRYRKKVPIQELRQSPPPKLTLGNISFSGYASQDLTHVKRESKVNIGKDKRVLFIGDTHEPFADKNYPDFLYGVYKDFECDTVVHAGDEADFHAISRWPAEPEALGKMEEYQQMLERMKIYYDMFPNVYVCISNHTQRPRKASYRAGIPELFIRSVEEYMQAPKGWTWHEYVEIDGVRYEHGEGWSGMYPQVQAAKGNMQSTAIGHHHSKGGVIYLKGQTKQVFGLSSGCGVDPKAYAFRYGQYHMKKQVIGCGVVLGGKEAYFIPM